MNFKIIAAIQGAIIVGLLATSMRSKDDQQPVAITPNEETIEFDKDYLYRTYIKTKHDQVKLYKKLDSLGIDPTDEKYTDLIAYGGIFILSEFLEENTSFTKDDYLQEYRDFLKKAATEN